VDEWDLKGNLFGRMPVGDQVAAGANLGSRKERTNKGIRALEWCNQGSHYQC
jgi:hypothetical protein